MTHTMRLLPSQDAEQALAKVILEGDLSKLTPTEKVSHYKNVCESKGLNPLTQPFAFIRFQGKEILYAGKNCTEQLREINGISLKITSRDKFDDLYVVTSEATTKDGRTDSSTGAVSLKGLQGEALANAVMKAETKAKRRVTLSISGLGYLDESETDSIPNAKVLSFDVVTGEVVAAKAALGKALEGPSDDVANLYKILSNICKADDKLAGVEFCAELSDDSKKSIWRLMTPDEQNWVKSTLENRPNEA